MTLAMDTLFDVDELHGGGGGGDGGCGEAGGDLPLTPAQAAAVAERSRSLIVTANAGSGKTSVLVERFVRAVLDDGVDPARILAITFTEKAAGELRERLRARFLELGERDQARATEGAFVSTIHGFCARLLRAHPLAAGLDPRFAVLDEARAARAREEAFATALRAFLAGGEGERLDLAAAYNADRLRAAIVSAHEALRSQGRRRPRLPAVAPRPAPDAERAALAATHARFAAELADAGDGKKVGDARDALDACAHLLADLEAGVVPWPGRLEALRVVCGNATALQTDACEVYVAARDAFERACADHHAARAVPLLDELLGLFADAYAAAKRARGALDFDDLELEARALLERAPGLARAWAERFALIMVDEFQDTNRRQLALLESLERANLATVGDELQSIYAFRHADVAIFRERRGALGQAGAALELADNFRARPEILTVLNAAFAERFGPAFVPLRAGRPPADAGAGAGPPVELLLTDARGWEDVDLGATLPAAPAWRQAEARLVAQRVRELVDGGEARAGDIAILVRATASMPLLERALADVGLPALATAGRGFWTRQEVVDLVGWLSVLANPLDERSLVGVLASPLAGVSADGIAVATAAAREAGRDLWWALTAAFVGGEDAPWTEDLAAPDAAALRVVASRLSDDRHLAARLDPDALLERAVEAAGYDVHVLGLLGGTRRMANVDKLRRLARDFAAAEGPSLRAFLDHAAVLEQAQRREPEAPVDDPESDAVRLMTIHAAKGLEFGVVVVADLGRRPNTFAPALLVDGDRVGLRLELLDGRRATPALDYAELNERRLAADAAEEDRVAYVALTRARERLIVSGALDPTRGPNGSIAPIQWLAPAIVPDALERLAAEAPEPVGEAALTFEGDATAVRLVLNAPATLGAALREAAPAAAAEVPVAPTAPVPAPPSPAAPAAPIDPGTLSYSALAFYERCPLRFKAQRVLGLPDVPPPGAEPRPPGLEARDRGVLVHALLEELDLGGGQPPPAERVAAFAAELGLAATGDDLDRARALAGAFAQSPAAGRLAAAPGGVRHELEFAFELEQGAGPLLTGAVDLLAVEADGTWLIADAKTDAVAADAELEALTEAGYGIQRRLYALAALRAGAERVDVVHVYLERPAEVVSAIYTQADAPALVAELGAPAAGIARGEFAPTDEPHAQLCATCPARERLCPHPSELTLRPRPPR